MFKRILATFSVGLLLLGVCQADPASDAIRKKAEEYAKALQNNDFEAVAKCNYPKMVELVGGMDKMVAVMKQAGDQMAAKKFKLVSITVSDPGPRIVSGDKIYSVVETLVVGVTPDEKISQKSFLLAVSTDKGATWSLLDGSSLNSDNIVQIIPDFPSDFKFPMREPTKEEPVSSSAPAAP